MKTSLIAENLGMSTATLYRRLSEKGLTLGQFRDTSGNISDEKLRELKAIFSYGGEYDEKLREISLLSEKLSETENKLSEAEKRLSDAETQIAEAQARAMEADARTQEAYTKAAAAEAEAEKAIAEAEKRASDADAEAARLSQQLDDMRRQLEEARADRDKWNKAYEQESRAAAESRALQMQQLQRLLPERVGVIERLRRVFTRTKGEK